MINRVTEFCRKNNLFNDTNKSLLAISGGQDSVCLLDILVNLNIKPALAHCNFQLRGEESLRDASFVENLAKKYGLIFHLKTIDTKSYAAEHKLSVQEAARIIRYNWFEELRQAHQYSNILTAHHMNDQVETMIFNFFRGSGLRGLMGIPEENNYILRPLLKISRDKIETYNLENNLSFVNDSSNENVNYKRNFIRHELIPQIKKINPSIEKTLIRQNLIYSDIQQWIDFEMSKIREEYVIEHRRIIKFNHKELQSHPGFRTILHEILSPYGFEHDRMDDIELAILQKRSGMQFYSKDYLLVSHRDSIQWAEIKYLDSIDDLKINITHTGKYEFGSFVFELELITNVSDIANPMHFYIDESQLTQGISIKTWKNGDNFQPSGMKGKHKKISDFYQEMGLSILEKKVQPLLCIGDKIAWIPGIRASENHQTPIDQAKYCIRVSQR
jgi:tRNA(Ile)-lysidine synthase